MDTFRGMPPFLSGSVSQPGLRCFMALRHISFPWAMLGHSQAPWLPLIQIADLTGVYGITALIVLGNVTLYQVFFDGAPRRRSIVTLALLGLTLGYGAYRLSQPHASGSAMTVSLVQGNIDQSVKWSPE